jgi:MFS family permease
MEATLSTRRKIYVLIVLTLVAMLSVADRTLTAILQEPIRQEFHLSDSALGLFSGLIFALPYALVSVPFGLMADRVERSRLAAACLALWGVMGALCGLVGAFPQLLLARVAVAVGEGAGGPAMQSMVADLFSDKRRGTAIGIYFLATPFGAMLAIGVGGLVALHFGWRAAFLLAGIPALLLSLVMFLTMREPPRAKVDGVVHTPAPLGEVLRFVWRQRSLFHLIAGMAIGSIGVNAIGIWSGSFFIRYYGLNIGQIGAILGPLAGGAGIVGMLLGGILTDRIAQKDPRRGLWVIGGSLALMTPTMLLTIAMHNTVFAFAAFGVYTMISYIWTPGAVAVAQTLAGPSRRSTVAAIILTSMTLLGSGLGPQLAGLVSDLVKHYAGADSLRWSLIGFSTMGLWAAAHVLAARRTYLEDLKRAA